MYNTHNVELRNLEINQFQKFGFLIDVNWADLGIPLY